MSEMRHILEELGFGEYSRHFEEQDISPDIVGLLSAEEMKSLGIGNKSDMVKLRYACVSYGPRRPEQDFSRFGPKEFVVPQNVLENLLNDGFSIKEISRLLSISESTVYRRMRKFGMSKKSFSDINDIELDNYVLDASNNFPYCGENILGQIIKQKGIIVPRWRLRDSLHRVNETGVNERKRGRLKRRVYDVRGPNHLWHIDTNHKLIRWHLIIAGCIDGFSRLIIFLNCLDNNKAGTLLKCFTEGVSQFGLPLRVRSDKGLENTAIADFMIANRGIGRGSMLTGKSVHNQRIERLWRDVYTGVLALFYKLFYYMEDDGILDPLDDLQIAALHYTYIPFINQKLKIWQDAWAGHRMRTTKSSPKALWTSGHIQNPTGIDFVNAEYGTEGFGINSNDHDDVDGRPIITSVSDSMITSACKHQLDQEITSSWNSTNFGIDVYLKVLDIIKNHQ